MTYITPGRDPLGYLEFTDTALRIPFVFPLKGDSWQTKRMQLLQTFDPFFVGMYDIVLGNESKLNETSAEYVLYVDPDEGAMAREGINALLEQQ